MKAFRPIIVCGPGNDGGTQVARWLHYNGVHMWDRERKPFGEDEFVTSADIDCLASGKVADWSFKMRRLKTQRRRLNKPWGWKDPRTAELITAVMAEFPDAVYVRMRRKRQEIVDSMLKQYGPGEHKRWRRGEEQAYTWAHELVDLREGELDQFLEPAPVVKFDIPYKAIRTEALGEIGVLPAVIVAATKDCLLTTPAFLS